MTTTTDESATVKVEEAARILGIGRQTAYELARAGKLPGALHLGRRIVVSRIQLDRYLAGEINNKSGEVEIDSARA